jgi:hypothetical protein
VRDASHDWPREPAVVVDRAGARRPVRTMGRTALCARGAARIAGTFALEPPLCAPPRQPASQPRLLSIANPKLVLERLDARTADVARNSEPPSLTRAGIPRRPAAAQQGNALPRRPTHDRGDRHLTRHAGDGVHGRATARADRRAVAGRAADLRCAHARRGRPGTRGAGRCWCGTATAAAAARTELRRVARQAGVRRRSAPHQLRHAHAVEMAREGVPLILWWVE